MKTQKKMPGGGGVGRQAAGGGRCGGNRRMEGEGEDQHVHVQSMKAACVFLSVKSALETWNRVHLRGDSVFTRDQETGPRKLSE